MEKHFTIHLHSYYPDNKTEGRKKGDYLAGSFYQTNLTTLSDAINTARTLWTELNKKYPGCMKETWIHQANSYPPKIGPVDALFYNSNLDQFKPGTKRGENSPF